MGHKFKFKKQFAIMYLMWIVGMVMIASTSIITSNFYMCLTALIMYIISIGIFIYILIRTNKP
jgi:hypothetical protein